MASQNIRWKSLIGALVCGIIISLTTGVIENPPEASIIGARYYGHPLVWRVTMTLQPNEFRLTSLAIDTAFWITISLLALVILRKILKKTSPSTEAAAAASAAAAAAQPVIRAFHTVGNIVYSERLHIGVSSRMV